ncbi:archaetidylserine decarboxylase [Utexia brackfieldae]|uniref:archaetidylserine decarboxylase n=1 Tax=Utexia brackfieldae TaxID=3074108 RepID=UPI00370D730F
MLNNLKALIQYLLPKQLLTQFFGCLASKHLGVVTTWMIKGFAKLYKVNMHEASEKNPEKYRTFNDFFARQLAQNMRPIAEDEKAVVMPADGMISQFGRIEAGHLIQAKGHTYSLASLLACNTPMVDALQNGHYMTTYLSPRDYHRVHMPCDGILREMIYVPGSLFSVNQATTATIPNIFARNERVICYFETEYGPMVQVLVGATIVGSIEVSWQGVVTPPRDGVLKSWQYEDVRLAKGDDMGCFKLGSTVITLFAENSMTFADKIEVGMQTRVGQAFGVRI